MGTTAYLSDSCKITVKMAMYLNVYMYRSKHNTKH